MSIDWLDFFFHLFVDFGVLNPFGFVLAEQNFEQKLQPADVCYV